LELDRFSEANLNRWREISNDLDELQSVLYFNLVPERRRHRDDLLQAVATATRGLLVFSAISDGTKS
jgi:hypothetical protein